MSRIVQLTDGLGFRRLGAGRHAQTVAREMIEHVRHPKLGEIPVIGTPVKYSRMRPGVRTPAPLQSEHTDEVLAEWGYSADEIGALRAK